jgi:hypothetical protein
MNIKKRVKSYKNTEHYKKVKQAEKELDKRIIKKNIRNNTIG